MFMEDNDEMGGIESSSFLQSPTPNFAPPPYQPTASFPAYQPTIPMNAQQPPPYPGSSQMSTMQNQSTDFQPQNQPTQTAATTLQSNSQLLNASFSPGFNAAAFPTSSGLAPVSNNQFSGGVTLNSIGDANANSDSKLAMIKSFSNESGMNDEWTKK